MVEVNAGSRFVRGSAAFTKNRRDSILELEGKAPPKHRTGRQRR
jgi:hypothetical protein